ncbi:hypothetical protein ABC382_00185 [Lysinibacillus sp. 1P01SD]|uniref:hypothetical protein n=1 Tax=Lysinibacillus sp. 1P01SD TaxID=3132285 RepID=UPI0039A3D181
MNFLGNVGKNNMNNHQILIFNYFINNLAVLEKGNFENVPKDIVNAIQIVSDEQYHEIVSKLSNYILEEGNKWIKEMDGFGHVS